MPTFSGTVTSAQGVRTIDVTPNDVVTFTPTSGTYSVEYPLGTVAVAATGSSSTVAANAAAAQMRILCVSGSVAYACVDGRDDTNTLTPAAAAAAQAFFTPKTAISTSDYYKSGTFLFDSLRRAWELSVAELQPGLVWQRNLGTVVYVDPSSPTNGVGSFSSPRNVMPGFSSNQTVLLKECTTIQLGANPNNVTNWLLGTYDARTGGRVLDKTRLATLNGGGATGINISGTSVNAWISGIRAINFTTAGLQKGQNASASGGGIEHSLVENAVPGVMVTAIQSFVGGSIIRFNTVNRVSGDAIWCGQNTNTSVKGFQIYGNDLRLGLDNSYDGPDCIQLSSNNGESVGDYVVHTNWCENTTNRKQVLIATYNNTLTATDGLTVYKNVFIGADTSLPMQGGNNQNGVFSEIPNTRVYANFVLNSRYPIVVTSGNPTFVNGAQIYGNLVVVDMKGLLRTAIEASSTAGSGVLTRITNNTIIGISCGGTELSPGILPAISSIGPADIRNNAIVGTFWGRTIQVNATNAGAGNLIERGNAFDSRLSTFVFDTGAGARAVDATSWAGVENWLDEYYRPIRGTALDYGGTPYWGNLISDVFGEVVQGSVGSIGACHPLKKSLDPSETIPLVWNALDNYTGPWVPARAHRLYTRFESQLNGGGVLTATVQGKLRTQLDSAAATLNTITLGGGGGLTNIGTVVDCAAHDLVRVVVTGYSAHGVVNLGVVV